MQSVPRIYGIDLAKSFAIFLVIVSHSLTAFGSGTHLHPDILLMFFRAATPTFVIVFGVFLELVYARNLATQGYAHTQQKLFIRAVQCYALYAISCTVLAVSRDYSLLYLARMLLLMGATPFTGILKFYTAMLLLAPLLLILKAKYGLRPLILFCLLVHAVHAAFYPLPYYDDFTGSEIVFGYLYGATSVIAGPSVLHGITFVVTGMWLGGFIRRHQAYNHLLSVKAPQTIFVLATCLLALAIGAAAYGGDFKTDLLSMRLRNTNSFTYFLFGIIMAILIIDISMRITSAVTPAAIKRWLFLGNTSLFTFSFGNCVLYVVGTRSLEKPHALMATALAIVYITLLSWAFNDIRTRIGETQSTNGWLKAYHYLSKGYAEHIVNMLMYRSLRDRSTTTLPPRG